ITVWLNLDATYFQLTTLAFEATRESGACPLRRLFASFSTTGLPQAYISVIRGNRYGRGQMALQIQYVMKQAQDLDHVAVRRPCDAEHDEMTPSAALAGDVQRDRPDAVVGAVHDLLHR
ncbi:MAG: hypothetical protein KJZ98_16615, partial [Burkholderiaceae bacterium]|nr:hypothetical protein [Burkholderiaceae bacterium]